MQGDGSHDADARAGIFFSQAGIGLPQRNGPQRVPAARWAHLWRTFRYDADRPVVRPARLAYPPLFCFDHIGPFISRRPQFVNDALISFRMWSILTIQSDFAAAVWGYHRPAIGNYR
jgi:hypothetical protein